MARRMEPKTREDVVLDHKLDIARTITRLRSRIADRDILNELEASIKQAHRKEVDGRNVTVPEIPSNEAVAAWVAPGHQLEGGTSDS